MKKLLLFLFVLALFLVGCSQGATPAATSDVDKDIVIYNWTDYMDPEVYALFEAEFGIKVTESNFSNNDELLTKLMGGSKGYALIVPSDFTVSILIKQGLVAPLDKTNIPNLSNLAEAYQHPPYDPNLDYCVPYLLGTTAIGYLSDKIEEPTSWSVFFEPDPNSPTYGRATMLDDARETFAAALIYLGYSVNTTNPEELQQARDILIKAKAGLAGFDADIYDNLVASGEYLVAHGWNGDFLLVQEDNENVAYTYPKEGALIYIDNICIPATATPGEKLAAEMFINFILRPEISAKIAEYAYYGTPNAAAEKLLPEEFLNNPAIYPPADVLPRLQYLEPVGEAESLYQRLWDEVKAAP